MVIRLEELAPFPVKHIQQQLSQVSANSKVFYAQEECLNQGAFQFAKLHIDRVLKARGSGEMQYIGRSSQHSFATGSNIDNKYESEKLWKDFEKAIYS